jgi:plastocyanin
MKKYSKISLIIALVLATGTLLAGDVTGTIKWEGDAPKMKKLKMDADPVCSAAHTEPVLSETLVMGEGNTMANIVVTVKSGLPAGKSYDPPSDKAVLDQHGCVYHPHVLGVMAGQSIEIRNSDTVLHNVNAKATVNRGFNLGMPKGMAPQDKVFTRAETVQLKCNVHPWMKAYIHVSDHPYFAVTGTDGKFTLKGLPAGTYEIEAWHEKAGTKTATVTVAASGAVTQDFTFSR